MSRLAKLSARFIGEVGFSIGITDVTPATKLLDGKSKIIQASYGICDDFIHQFKTGNMELLPGSNEEESLEVRAQMMCGLNKDFWSASQSAQVLFQSMTHSLGVHF